MPELIFKPDGRVILRPFEITAPNEREMRVDDAMLSCLNVSSVRKMPGLFRLPEGKLGVSIINTKPECFFSLEMTQLSIHTTIEISVGVAFPTFKESGEAIRLTWPTPPDMRLVLGGLIHPPDVNHPTFFWCQKAYLFAFKDTNCFLLPMANLHLTGQICTGLGAGQFYSGDTSLQCFQSLMAAFYSSNWGHHLIDDQGNGRERCQQFFRFRPTDTGFVPLPCGEGFAWQNLCKTIGTDVLNWVTL